MSLLRVCVLASLLRVPGLHGQQGTIPAPVPNGFPTSPGRGAGAESGPFNAASQERLEKSRQTDRQRRMIADTDKLLTLATELKADMDKTTKDTLSIEVIKKAEEIEKLAKSVKERMKG